MKVSKEQFVGMTYDELLDETVALGERCAKLRELVRDMCQQIRYDDETFRDLRERGYVDEDYDGDLGKSDRAPEFEARMRELRIEVVDAND